MPLQTIKLTYVADSVVTEPDKIEIATGDTLTFTSDQGNVCVLLDPDRLFSAREFHTGDQPVRVLSEDKFTFCCGVVIDGKVLGYPEHKRFGHTGEPITR